MCCHLLPWLLDLLDLWEAVGTYYLPYTAVRKSYRIVRFGLCNIFFVSEIN